MSRWHRQQRKRARESRKLEAIWNLLLKAWRQ